MSSSSWLFASDPGSAPPSASKIITDHRAQIAAEEREKADRRREQLAEQHASFSSPEARIQAWEKLHELRLPLNEDHPVLDVIAAATHLTLQEVREEQRARALRRNFQAPGAP